MRIRKPHVAGQFYEGTEKELRHQISSCFSHPLAGVTAKESRKIVGVISPHAGYSYSGHVAARGYDRISRDGIPETFIILGPNHSGRGGGVSIQTEGAWQTPLGLAQIDSPLAKQIQKASEIIDIDENAHSTEHSIEVQLPFIQFISESSVRFIPICSWMQDLETSREIAKSIVDQTRNKNFVIIASSDFTHHERSFTDKDEDQMLKKIEEDDKRAIDAISRLDDVTLNALGETQRVTMCGYGPITTLIAVAKLLGSIKTEFLEHKTSYEITRDPTYVVGYSSILFLRD
ncbi:MAG TPA: AmmeMemoRadiSam system protein B [Candidatus Bathyarchaeia archaeon]|nr:AmmeMemoRadiSam system protein B [Candidatus Bathyarchaeia archaeon]